MRKTKGLAMKQKGLLRGRGLIAQIQRFCQEVVVYLETREVLLKDEGLDKKLKGFVKR